MPAQQDAIARAIRETLVSPNELDQNLEAANVVDAIVKAGRIVGASIGTADPKKGDRETLVGALNRIADAIFRLADVTEGK